MDLPPSDSSLPLPAGGGGANSKSQPLGAAVPQPAPGWPRGLRALSYRDFRLLWSGMLVSNVGAWMQMTAQAWVVYEISGHDPAWLGLDAFAAGVPVLLTPAAGVLVDHMDRRRLIRNINIAQMMVSAFLAIGLGVGFLQVWHIIICSFISGMLNTIGFPAFFSFMPELVNKKDLTNAVAMNALQFNASRVVGPVIGGLVLHHVGAAWSFGLNALSFIAVLTALGMINQQTGHRPPATLNAWESFKQGMAYLRTRRDLILMLALVTTSGLLGSPLMSMLPALCRVSLNRPDEAAYATLLSSFGLGAVLGALLLAIRSHATPKPWRAIPIIVGIGFCQIALKFTSEFTVAVGLLFVSGALFVGTMARLNTAVTASIPSELRGRVTSTVFMGIGIGIPMGSLLAGFIAKHLNVSDTFLTFGMAMVTAALVLLGVKQWLGIEYTPVADSHHAEARVENKVATPEHAGP